MLKSIFEIVQNDRGKLFATKGLVLLDQAVVSATSFLTTLIIGNACGADSLGIYSIGFSIVLLTCAIQTALVSTPFTVFASRISDDKRATRSASSLINLALVTALIFAVVLIAWMVVKFAVRSEFGDLLAVSLVVFPFVIGREFIRKFFLLKFHAMSVLVFDIFIALMHIGTLLLLANAGKLTPLNALLVLAASCLVAACGFFVLQKKEFKLDSARVRKDITEDWKFGKWLVAEQFFTIVSVYGAPWLLAILMDSTAVGIFAACFSITGLSNPFLMGLGNFLLPKFSKVCSKNSQAAVDRLYWNYMLFTFTIMLAFAAVCIVFGATLMELIFRKEAFSGHGLIISILAIRSLIGAIGLTSHFALLAMQKPRVSMFASIGSVLTLVVSSLVLIPTYQVAGAAVAWTLATTFESSFMIAGYQKHRQDRKFQIAEAAI